MRKIIGLIAAIAALSLTPTAQAYAPGDGYLHVAEACSQGNDNVRVDSDNGAAYVYWVSGTPNHYYFDRRYVSYSRVNNTTVSCRFARIYVGPWRADLGYYQVNCYSNIGVQENGSNYAVWPATSERANCNYPPYWGNGSVPGGVRF